MSSGTAIIERALQSIGAHSVLSPAAPESISLGMNVLNSMLELWLSRNIQIGFTVLQNPGDQLNEPPDTTNGIVTNLAIELSPSFDNGGNVASAELRNAARRDLGTITNLYRKIVIPKKVVSSTMPKGAGNRAGRIGAGGQTFFDRGDTINN